MGDGDRYASAFEDCAVVAVPAADERPLTYDSWQVGSLRFLSGSSAPVSVDRSGDEVARFEVFTISLLVSGTSKVTAEGRTCLFGPGDLILIDERFPYATEASATSFVTMLIDCGRVLMPHQLPDEFSTNARKTAGLGATALAAFVRTMIFNRQPTNMIEAEQISRAAGELVRGVRLTMRLPTASDDRRHPVHDSVREFVTNNLTSQTLTPEAIASALRISRSTLYRAFAATGGVAQLIQAMRMDAARDLLLMPGETRSIAEIADHFHFSGAAHFSRVFKTRYGVTPQRLRARGRIGDPDD
ncbi:AraC family transcriptional regulator [Fulvimarina endophytica]|uniref:AraC family transcriptional regulator n=1 Tax=Fulvimarina endophytica TaxID=2293836 RepID=A0A371X9X3_9HYPH|nr:AraC family transcriptional regulator [Fulvimarina endophytica]RFC65992.1 AraC family transcriptional regulator [Fulvimarina endophytica]